jgi:hypothetical protein
MYRGSESLFRCEEAALGVVDKETELIAMRKKRLGGTMKEMMEMRQWDPAWGVGHLEIIR